MEVEGLRFLYDISFKVEEVPASRALKSLSLSSCFRECRGVMGKRAGALQPTSKKAVKTAAAHADLHEGARPWVERTMKAARSDT